MFGKYFITLFFFNSLFLIPIQPSASEYRPLSEHNPFNANQKTEIQRSNQQTDHLGIHLFCLLREIKNGKFINQWVHKADADGFTNPPNKQADQPFLARDMLELKYVRHLITQ